MKPEWGHKHECPSCGAHFYDMRNPDACCPKCNAPINDEAALMAKKGGLVESSPPPPKDILDDFDELDDVEDLSDDDDDFIEDTDDLVGTDEADMSEIMEHIDEGVADQNL